MTAYRRGLWEARRNAAANGASLGFLGGMTLGIVICLAVWWCLDDPDPHQGAALCDVERCIDVDPWEWELEP